MKPAVFGVENMSTYLSQVDELLLEFVPQRIRGLDRMLAARGKRLRPGIVLAIAWHYEHDIDKRVLQAAAAVELVHLASLIHDDLMDDGGMRHGVATIHSKEGADWALLAGDYLIAQGIRSAAQVSAEAAVILSEAVVGLCEGQAHELAFRHDASRTEEDLLAAAQGKTSSLFRAAVGLGCEVAEVPGGDKESLLRFAELFGVTFQLRDDIADFAELPTEGKPVGSDLSEGTYTLPVILALAGPHGKRLKDMIARKEPPAAIRDALQADGALDRARLRTDAFAERAEEALGQLSNAALAAALRALLARS